MSSLNRPAPWPGSTDGHDKTFHIDTKSFAEIEEWKNTHHMSCDIPEWRDGFTPTSKYSYQFRETGIGDEIKIICACGAEFAPVSQAENI